MNIRKAALKDAKGIAKVHVDSWRTTYKNIVPDDYLEKLSYDQRTELWKRNIVRNNNIIYVAENHQGDIVGFAGGGQREENQVEKVGDLTSIYILEDYQGEGIGKELLRQLVIQFEELALDHVFVEVLKDNKTRYFYEHYGATLVETKEITIAGKPLELLVYKLGDIKQVRSRLN